MKYSFVRAYDNYIEANMELALLQQAGIDCHIKDEYTITIDPLLSPALGGMKLMVADQSLSTALELLNNSHSLFLQSMPCPACNNMSLELVTTVTYYKSLVGRLKSMLINGQEQEVKKYYHCNTCEREFSELPRLL